MNLRWSIQYIRPLSIFSARPAQSADRCTETRTSTPRASLRCIQLRPRTPQEPWREFIGTGDFGAASRVGNLEALARAVVHAADVVSAENRPRLANHWRRPPSPNQHVAELPRAILKAKRIIAMGGEQHRVLCRETMGTVRQQNRGRAAQDQIVTPDIPRTSLVAAGKTIVIA